MNRLLVVALSLLSSLALAEVGKVAALEGEATRTPKGGAALALKTGSEVELGDTLTVKSGDRKSVV